VRKRPPASILFPIVNNLSPGTRLGPYEVVAPAGAGGMGEVWRARDTRLERSVAIKVLPSDFATNAQLRMRFEREAKSISQLNHPNICTLYDVGQHDGSEYLVMEFIEGESLADRLARGPLPIDQVIRYGIEIAGALHRAHLANIVHRDLKPGNVMITKSGAKLLDFGLAKDGQPLGAVQELTSLQTEKRSLTEEGTIVGTFQYMSPEQLEGQPVDHRADIFALGALLYEMATGRRAFAGKSRASLIASILATDPAPISTVQPLTPPALERIIRTCLLKDPDERFQSAHDVRLELEWVAAGGEAAVTPSRRRTRRETVAWALAAMLAIAAGIVSVAFVRARVAERNAPAIFTSIVPPAGTTFDFSGPTGPPTISPDGKKIVFSISGDGVRRLWIRSLHSSVTQPLSGTDGATFPFWSPDSRFVGFFADEKLKKIEAGGGAAVAICDAPDARGGAWSRDGVILFSGRFTPLSRVNAAGGAVTEATSLDPSGRDVTHRWPRFLPDGRHFFYLASPLGSDDNTNAIYLGSLDDKSLHKQLVNASSQPMYFDGHLLFVRDGILVAQRFDEKSLTLSGDPMTLTAQQIGGDSAFSRRDVSIADDGTLVYQAGETARTSQLLWFDRSGKATPALEGRASYGALRLTPDGRFAVVAIRAASANNLWLADLQRGVKTRLTFGRDGAPTWSPDGKKIAFTSRPKSFGDLHVYDLTTGADEAVLVSDIDKNVSSWSPDGSTLFYTENNRTGSGSNIRYLTLADRKSHVYLATQASELNPMISPDGRWIAYQSNASGRWEIYLAPFPPTGAKWQVSTSGGVAPRWRRDGAEIFLAVPDGSKVNVTAVPVALGEVPQIGAAVSLFRIASGAPPGVPYDITADGRILVNARVDEDERPPEPLTLVQNFANEIRAAGAKGN
jgi:serine/threonine protein kinase